MAWWLWLLAGLVLIVVELLTPGGFYVLFFGVSALAVGILAAFGLAGPVWLQWVLFSALSIVSLGLLRRPLLGMMRTGPVHAGSVDTLVGEMAMPLEEIRPGEVGKAELRGTAWSARNDGPAPLARGQRCRVEAVDGLLLRIRPEGGAS